MTAWPDALRATADGVILEVEVVPGSARAEFPAGYNPWRNRFEARVPAPPVEGRANLALCQLLATFFELPLRDVRVVSGETSRQKRVLLVGIEIQVATHRLASVLGPP